jgi:hypothetical protein
MCSHSAVICYNGGECTDGQSCTCPPGYGGVNCRGRRKILIGTIFLFRHLFSYSSMWIWVLL